MAKKRKQQKSLTLADIDRAVKELRDAGITPLKDTDTVEFSEIMDATEKAPPAQPPQHEKALSHDPVEHDEVYLPPRLNIESMTKEQLATLSMRHFGVRPDPTALKDAQVAEVRRRMRAGRPSYLS